MIVVETIVNKNIQTVWECWTMPEHIVKWNFASEDWHAPAAKNDLNLEENSPIPWLRKTEVCHSNLKESTMK